MDFDIVQAGNVVCFFFFRFFGGDNLIVLKEAVKKTC